MNTIVLRDSAEEDITPILRIYAHHVQHGVASFELIPPDATEMAARRRTILERGLPYLVAVDNGLVTGYGYLGPYRPRPAYRYIVEDSVYVAPEAIGRGVGSRLLAALIERADTAGYRQMMAVIGLDPGEAARNASASVLLHRRFGFRDVGQIEGAGYKKGRWVDTLIMQRTLGEGTSSPPADRG